MSDDVVAVEIGVLAFELARGYVLGARDHATPGTLTDVHADDEVIEFASAYARYYQRHKHVPFVGAAFSEWRRSRRVTSWWRG